MTFFSVSRRFLTFDTITVASVVACAAVVVTNAYSQGRVDLDKSTSSASNSYTLSNKLLTKDHVQLLSSSGAVIIDNCLTTEERKQVRIDLLLMEAQGRLVDMPNKDDSTRSDRVCFLLHSDRAASGEDVGPGLTHVKSLLRGVANGLDAHGFQGFQYNAASPSSYVLKVPNQLQVARYAPGGSFYRPHIDGVTAAMSREMGVVDYLSTAGYRARAVTVILYLNCEPPWVAEDGGALRLHAKDGESFEDIKPMGGRMIIFDSKEVLHEVRPTTSRERYAATIWLTNEP